MRKLLVLTALIAALVAGPVLAQEATDAAVAAPATAAADQAQPTKAHVKKAHAKKAHKKAHKVAPAAESTAQ